MFNLRKTLVTRRVHAGVLMLLAPAVAAMQCDDGLVNEGAHKAEVRKACGKPQSTDHVVEYPVSVERGFTGRRLVRVLDVPLVTEEWLYDFGPNRFMRVLRFRGSRLIDIQTLEKGGLDSG